jgi:membrane protease subunit (stomatin/prohibitin family)
MAMGKAMNDALNQVATGGDAAQKTSPATPTALPDQGAAGAAGASASATKFCVACGKSIPRSAKFCPECGGAQG